MIGIDIVDLSDPLLKKRTKNEFRLIQSEHEILFDQPQLFWVYWTAKEAVFKASRDLIRFQPKNIEIKLDPTSLRFVSHYNSLAFHGACEINENFIFSYCHIPSLKVNFEILHAQTSDWSKHIRTIASNKLKETNKGLKITSDNDGLPIISKINLPISFSHHHRRGAYIHPLWHT